MSKSDLPAGWKKLTLGDVITLKRGYDLPTNTRGGGSIPVVSSAGITGRHNVPKVQPPGVVTGRYGTTGEIYYINEPFWPLNTTLYVVDFKGNDQLFIYYMLQSIDFDKFSGKTGVPGVNRNDLHEIPMFLPPLPEQRAIAAILTTWDEAITLTQALIEALQYRKQALMQLLLTGQVQFQEFEGGKWEYGVLADIAYVEMGQSPAGETYNIEGKGIPLINGPTEFTQRYPVKLQWTTQPTKLSEPGDILLCVRGSSTGRMNISNDVYCIGRGIAAIRAHANLGDTTFIENVLIHGIHEILSRTAGSTFPNIDKKSLNSIPVLIAPLPEQQQIATLLSTSDEGVRIANELVESLQTQKRALMQQLLTGTIRVQGLA